MQEQPSQVDFHVVFVCWGNICRSPAAEATFRKLVEDRSLKGQVSCDSAGTINQHAGNPPDPRMQTAAKARDLPIGGRARIANDEDFIRADLLVTMDDYNFSELSALAPDEESLGKIRPFCEYLTSNVREIPDPYYGGSSGFEQVLDLLDEGCRNLLDQIEQDLIASK